jgi:outer membrane protein assembly factor BamB
MPALSRRLFLTLLTCIGLVAAGCSSDDDSADSVRVGTIPTRARLPVAPSTTTGPPTTAGTPTATTTTAAPADPKGFVVTPAAYAACTGRGSRGASLPAPLVALDVNGGVLWSACSRGEGASTEPIDLGPTVGAVFVADADGTRTFHALTRDGQVAWSTPLPGASLVTDHASTVYVVTPEGAEAGTRALDAATGQERWRVPVEEARAARPETVVLVADAPAVELVARDPTTSERRWAQPLASVPTSVGIAGDVVVAVTESPGADPSVPVRTIAAYDLATGELRWSRDRNDVGTAVVVGDTLLVWGTDDTTASLDLATGAERWRRLGRPLGGVGGVGVAADGMVFLSAASGDTNVRVVDLGTGQSRWSTGAADLRAQALGAGAGLLLFFTSLRGVEAVDLATGAGRWSFDFPPTPGTTTSGVSVSPDLVLVTVGASAA